jgi:cysteine synthase A
MPETMTLERRAILKAYGATLVLTPGPLGMKGSVDKAEEMAKADPAFWVVRQFENPANPEVHRRTTAEEVLEQVPELDAFVAGVGTGGTITGVGEVLAQRKPGTLVVAVEPVDSPLLTQGKAGPHKIQGLGANFVPAVLNREAYQRVEDVAYEDAIRIARRLTREEGIFTGISTGAIVHTALKVARELGEGRTVVAVVCDTGERYLSHPLFAEA